MVEISDGDEQIRLESISTVTLEPTETDPYMILEWERQEQENWYAEFKVVSSCNNTDIVFGKATFTGSDITGLDLSDRSYPTANYRQKFNEGLDLKSQLYTNVRKIDSSSDTLNDKDFYVGVDYGGSVSIDIPASEKGRTLIIKDESGSANTNNITLSSAGSETIDGSSNYIIDTDYGVVRLINDGNDNWSVI